MSNDTVKITPVRYFAMGEDSFYSFTEDLILNVFPTEKPKRYLAVSRGFDEFFVGAGLCEDEAIYNWKTWFHYNFQKFYRLGASNPKEEKLYRIMQRIVDMDAIYKNSTTNKTVFGTMFTSLASGECPLLFKLDGSEEICKAPHFEYVDSSFLFLKKGERFRGIFEYRDRDNKLLRILDAVPILNKEDEYDDDIE